MNKKKNNVYISIHYLFYLGLDIAFCLYAMYTVLCVLLYSWFVLISMKLKRLILYYLKILKLVDKERLTNIKKTEKNGRQSVNVDLVVLFYIYIWNVRVLYVVYSNGLIFFFFYSVSEKLKTGTCENKVDVEIRPYRC